MPDWRGAVRARLSSLRLSPTREADIVDELSQHLDDRYLELVGGGASCEEAADRALGELGDGDTLVKHLQPLRQAHVPPPVMPRAGTGHLPRDLWENIRDATRISVRTLRRDSGFTATAVLILALALAMNVTAFRIMDATLFHGYPLVKQNERMVFIDERFPYPGCCVSYADFDAWRAQAHSFEGLTFGVFKQVTLSENSGETRDVSVCVVSANAFHVLGVSPVMGRDFRVSEEAAGSAPVVIVSHRYWMTRWGGRADAIGGIVHLNGTAATIVGVMPQDFGFPQRTDIWMPLQRTADLYRTPANGSFVFGRLAGGTSEATARAEVEAINARLAAERPATNRHVYPTVRNFIAALAGPNASVLYGSLWAAAWLVLTIACANVASLALARLQRRMRELCTRMALGAGRGRLGLQWLVESVLLTAVAAFAAWWIASWGTQLWTAATATPYQLRDYAPNVITLAYLAVVASCVAVLISLVPISRLWRLDLNGALKGESQGATMAGRAKRLSATLVTGQMMLAIVLMSGTGVLAHSVWNVLRADLGIQTPENVLIGRLELPAAKYPTSESRAAFFEALRARLSATPEVTSAAIANGRPVDDHEPWSMGIEGQVGSLHAAPVFSTGPGYFHTIGAPLFAGRDFARADRTGATPVAIVNRSFADTYFPGQSAIGQRIRIYPKMQAEPDPVRTIVGVVANVMQNDAFRRRFHPAVYVPFAQQPTNYAWFFVRTEHLSDRVAATVRAVAREVDPKVEILDFATLKSSVGFEFTNERSGPGSAEYTALSRHAAIAPLFAAMALLLAAAGLYAVVARSVDQRTKEIGVRIALGAGPRAIRRLVLLEGMAPVTAGLVAGLIASLAVNRILQSQLVGVSPYDALTMTLAPLILIVVALLGCLLPIRQAVRLDPTVALRRD